MRSGLGTLRLVSCDKNTSQNTSQIEPYLTDWSNGSSKVLLEKKKTRFVEPKSSLSHSQTQDTCPYQVHVLKSVFLEFRFKNSNSAR